MEALNVRPAAGKIFGLTHDERTGESLIRVPRTLKVSIGLPPGKDVECVKDPGNPDTILVGYRKSQNENPTWMPCAANNPRDVMKKLQDANNYAWYRNYPKKLDYFTFVQPGPDGTVEYDVDSIVANPARPKEIDVVFIDTNPLFQQMEMWTSTELKCYGDGVNAMRVHALAKTEEEKQLSSASKAADPTSKYFPIVDGCHQRGCLYSRPTFKGDREVAPACKPHSKLKFQLISSLRLGTTVEYDSTSWRTGANLHSCLEVFRTACGDWVKGIPLKMVLRPFRAVHNGKPSIAYTVALEFRAETAAALRTKMIEAATIFRRAEQQVLPANTTVSPVRALIAAPASEPAEADPTTAEGEQEDFELRASTINQEFYGGQDDDDIESRSSQPADEPQGSKEAAAEVAKQKIAEGVKSGDLTQEDANKFGITDDDLPPILRQTRGEQQETEYISEDKLLGLIDMARELHQIKEADLRQISIGHGAPSLSKITPAVYESILADLRKPKPAAGEGKRGRLKL